MKLRNFFATVAAAVMVVAGATAQAQDTWSGATVGTYFGGWTGSGSAGHQQGLSFGYTHVLPGGVSSSIAPLVLGGQFVYGGYTEFGASYDHEYYLRGRAGLLVSPEQMIYGFAGYGLDAGEHAYQVGVGAERMLFDGFSGFLEYAYGNYMAFSSPWTFWNLGFVKRF